MARICTVKQSQLLVLVFHFFELSIDHTVVGRLLLFASTTCAITALLLLGVGWSMFLIGGSALLTASVPKHAKVTLQGASDSAMNLGGALMAAMAGTVLEMGGFLWINLMATGVLVITLAFAVKAVPLMRWPGRSAPSTRDEDLLEESRL